MIWWQWALLGLGFLALEILMLGGLGNFYFLFFGVAALLVGGLVWAGLLEAVWLQWVLFSVFGVLSLFVLQRPLQRPRKVHESPPDPIDTLQGEIATVLEDIPVQGAGKAELRGSTWTVRNTGKHPLLKGQRSQVTRVDGLTLWVQEESPVEEGHHVG